MKPKTEILITYLLESLVAIPEPTEEDVELGVVLATLLAKQVTARLKTEEAHQAFLDKE